MSRTYPFKAYEEEQGLAYFARCTGEHVPIELALRVATCLFFEERRKAENLKSLLDRNMSTQQDLVRTSNTALQRLMDDKSDLERQIAALNRKLARISNIINIGPPL